MILWPRIVSLLLLALAANGCTSTTTPSTTPGNLLAGVPTGFITTVAGGYTGDGMLATDGALRWPQDVTTAVNGDVFLADGYDIRKIDKSTGVLTTIATISWPPIARIASDGRGNLLLSSDDEIWSLNLATGNLVRIAGDFVCTPFGDCGDGGPALSASIRVDDITVDATGNVFLAGAHKIRRIDAASGLITTYAGTGIYGFSGDGGPATMAQLNFPMSIGVDPAGNLFIADRNNWRIRRVDVATHSIMTIAGNGTFPSSGDGGQAISAGFCGPEEVEADSSGNVFIVDKCFYGTVSATPPSNWWTIRVRRVEASTGIVRTIAGAGPVGFGGEGGPALSARFGWSLPIAVDHTGNLLLADAYNQRIREVDPATGIIRTIAGFGVGENRIATSVQLGGPAGLSVSPNGALVILDSHYTRIRRVDPISRMISTIAGGNVPGCVGDGTSGVDVALVPGWGWALQGDVALDAAENVIVADVCGYLRQLNQSTGVISRLVADGWTASTDGLGPGLVVDAVGDIVAANDNTVRSFHKNGQPATLIAGSGSPCLAATNPCGDGGPATAADLSSPEDVAIDPSGNVVIADTLNNRIRRVEAATGIISTIAGSGSVCYPAVGSCGDGGPATSAALSHPHKIAFDGAGNLFIGEDHRIRRVHKRTEVITTVAGTGDYCFWDLLQCGDNKLATSATLSPVRGLALDAAGNVFFSSGDSPAALASAQQNRVRGVRHPGAQFIAPLAEPSGMVHDGNLLRIIQRDPQQAVVSIDTSSDLTVSSFAIARIGLSEGSGIAADGSGYIFVAGVANTQNVVEEIDPGGPTVIQSFNMPFQVGALAFDGTQLFISDWNSGTILVSNRSGNVIRSFDTRRRPADLDFDRLTGHLWMIDQMSSLIFELQADGSLVQHCDSPRYIGYSPRGGLALGSSMLAVAEVSDPDLLAAPVLRAKVHVLDRSAMVCSTPASDIQNLANAVTNLMVANGVKTSLAANLSRAVTILTDGDPTNDAMACAHLQAFLDDVNQQEANGALTASDASHLRELAQQLMHILAC